MLWVLCNCERAKVRAKRDSKNKNMQFFLTYLSGVRLENWVKREHLGGCHTHFSVRLWHVTYSARIVKRDLSSFLVDFHEGAGLSRKWWTDSKHHFNLRLKTPRFNISALYFTLYSRYAISELQKLWFLNEAKCKRYLSCDNEFSWHENKKPFSCQWLRT